MSAVPDAGGQPNQDITSFLREELWVIGRAEEVALLLPTIVGVTAPVLDPTCGGLEVRFLRSTRRFGSLNRPHF